MQQISLLKNEAARFLNRLKREAFFTGADSSWTRTPAQRTIRYSVATARVFWPEILGLWGVGVCDLAICQHRGLGIFFCFR